MTSELKLPSEIFEETNWEIKFKKFEEYLKTKKEKIDDSFLDMISSSVMIENGKIDWDYLKEQIIVKSYLVLEKYDAGHKLNDYLQNDIIEQLSLLNKIENEDGPYKKIYDESHKYIKEADEKFDMKLNEKIGIYFIRNFTTFFDNYTIYQNIQKKMSQFDILTENERAIMFAHTYLIELEGMCNSMISVILSAIFLLKGNSLYHPIWKKNINTLDDIFQTITIWDKKQILEYYGLKNTSDVILNRLRNSIAHLSFLLEKDNAEIITVIDKNGKETEVNLADELIKMRVANHALYDAILYDKFNENKRLLKDYLKNL